MFSEFKLDNNLYVVNDGAEEDIFKAYNLYANCYVTKPVDPDQFITVIKSIENFWFSIVNLPKGVRNG